MEPTYLKNVSQSNWIISPSRDEKKQYESVKLDYVPKDRDENKQIFELPPPSA